MQNDLPDCVEPRFYQWTATQVNLGGFDGPTLGHRELAGTCGYGDDIATWGGWWQEGVLN